MSAPAAQSPLAALLARAATGAPPGHDDGDERILDAALTEFAAHGTRGATIDGIAASAGVARITVFRRFGSKGGLLERLVVRELTRFLRAVDASLDAADDPADRVAEAFVACVRAGAAHPLVARVVRDDPAEAFSTLAIGAPSPLELGRLYVAARIRADLPGLQAEADAVADVLVRLAATYVLVPSPVVDVTDEAAARAFARRVLAPLIA